MPLEEFKELKQRSLFAKLKRLFSNEVVVRNVGGKKLKVVDTHNLQFSTDKQSLRDRFNKIRTSNANLHTRDFTLSYQSSRIELFRDYDVMDLDPIISSALDIFSDESLTPSELGNILTITSPNENIREILNNLFYDILNIEFNLWSWTRNLVKYGDAYLKLYISPEYGVYRVEPIGSYNVTRVENSTDDKNYVKFHVNLPEGGKIEELEDYEVAHFRLLSDSNFAPYGKSMVEGARRVWKQVNLMEDSMLIHRVMRAPTKRIFKVDVGNIPPHEVDQYMEKTISKTKKIPYVDEATGDYNLRFNLQNMVEDFYLPVRGSDSGTSIDTLEGMTFTGIDDVEYLRNKLMSALKIPKAFLGYENDLSGKAILAAEDVRFARTIGRIQRIIVSELTKIAIVHLFSQGYQDEQLIDFKLDLTNPSTIFEKEKISVWQEKVSLADDALENNIFSRKWIYKNVFKMSDDDVATMTNDIVEDVKQTYRHTQIKEEGVDPAKEFNKMATDTGGDGGGDGGGEGGGDTGGEDGGLGNMDAALGADSGEQDPESGPGTPASPSPPEKPIAEKTVYRDQTGRKNARDYPYGEDPLGSLENNEKPNKTTKKSPITHKFSKRNPLYLEKFDMLMKSSKDGKIELIQELESAAGSPKTQTQILKELKPMLERSKRSFLDEDNIIDNNA